MIIYILIGILVLFILFSLRPSIVTGHWQQYFGKAQLSSQEIFSAIEAKIKEHQANDVRFSRTKGFEFGAFSAQREYLEIEGRNYIFHVGAAPYGVDFFVSIWQRQKQDNIFRAGLVRLLPFLNRRTYYSVDTEVMFRSCVHNSVLEVLDDLSAEKGIRKLSELDRQWQQDPKLMFKVS